jgi:hypothetical protein
MNNRNSTKGPRKFLGFLMLGAALSLACAAAHYDGASAHSLGVAKAAICIADGQDGTEPSVLTENSDEQTVGATESAEETAKTTSVKETTSSICQGTLILAESRGFTGWDTLDAVVSGVIAWFTFGAVSF